VTISNHYTAATTATGTQISSLTFTTAAAACPVGGDDVVAIVDCSTANQSISSVTWGGVAMTAENEQGTGPFCRQFRLVNPPRGAQSVVVTYAGSAQFVAAIAYSVAGVDQVAPDDAVAVGANSSSVNITTVTDGARVIDIARAAPEMPLSAGAGQTQIAVVTGDSIDTGASFRDMATAGATTMSWTNGICVSAMALKPSPITSAFTKYAYGDTALTAPTPAGTGGALVVVGIHGGGFAPDIAGDWTLIGEQINNEGSARIKAYVATKASPNMGFTVTGNDPPGICTIRDTAADMGATVQWGGGAASSASTYNLPDITTAVDGNAILIMSENQTATHTWSHSGDAGFKELFDGEFSTTGWWGMTVALASVPALPGGATYDAGTVTSTSTSAWGNLTTLIIPTSTGGGGGPRTGAAALSATATLTAAGHVVRKGASNLSASGTITATGQKGAQQGASTLNATATITAAGHLVRKGASTLAATATLTAAGNKAAKQGSSTLTATAVLTAAGHPVRKGASALSATATLTATGNKGAQQGSVSLAAAASLTASGHAIRKGGIALTGTATLSATGNKGSQQGAASLTASTTLTVSGHAIRKGALVLTGTGTLSATGSPKRNGAVSLQAGSVLAATGRPVRKGASTLSATATLTATGKVGARVGSSSLSASATLTAAGVLKRNGAVALSATATLTATGQRSRKAQGILLFAGSATLTASGRAVRKAASSLTGTAAITATATGGTPAGYVPSPARYASTGNRPRSNGQKQGDYPSTPLVV